MNMMYTVLLGSCFAVLDIGLIVSLKKSILAFKRKALNQEVMGMITGTAEYMDYNYTDAKTLTHVPVVTYRYKSHTYQRIPLGAERMALTNFPLNQPIKIFISVDSPEAPSFTPFQLDNTLGRIVQPIFFAFCLMITLPCSYLLAMKMISHIR